MQRLLQLKIPILLSSLIFGVAQVPLAVASATGDQAVIPDLYELSLKELVEIKVSVASKRREDIFLAPGNISVITSTEIDQFGARNLRDVLERLVNVGILGSHLRPHGKASIRGVNQTNADNAVLVLINGRPMREGAFGGVSNTDFYQGFPLTIIEQIEVIRGPGSVLYGTNAFAGVINIVTKVQSGSLPKMQSDISYGSYDRQQAELTTFLGGTDWNLSAAFNYAKSDGDAFNVVLDEAGISGTYLTEEKTRHTMIQARYKRLTVNLMHDDNSMSNVNAVFKYPADDNKDKRLFFDLGYEQPISNNWTLYLNATHNQQETMWHVRTDLPVTLLNTADGQENLYEVNLRGKIGDHANLIVGASHTKIEAEWDIGLDHRTAKRDGIFAQVDYQFSAKQKLIAGFQINKPEESDSKVSSRLGFIQGFGGIWWLKLNYAEAFRSPFIAELFLDAPALTGNPKLTPETIQTEDIQLMCQTDKYMYALTLYHSEHNELITRVREGGEIPMQTNSGGVEFKGIEFEAKHQLSQNLSLFGNASWQTNETHDNVDDSTFSPQTMIKLGLNYNSGTGINTGIFISYFGDSTDLTKTVGAQPNNTPADAYNLLTANFTLDIGKFSGQMKKGRHQLSLYLDNILDEDIYSPDLNHRTINNTIPHHAGFGTYLTYTYKH